MFPKKEGISKYFLPHVLLGKKQVDYKKEFEFSYGNYVQAFVDLDSKTSQLPQSIDALYLRPLGSPQGGHQVMDLQTGRMSRRGRCKKCKMTRLVIDTVNKMATKQGYKALKFLDRKKRPMFLNPIDTLSGVGAITNKNLEALEQNDEEYLPMTAPKSCNDDDSKLIVDFDINQDKLADLISDSGELGQALGEEMLNNNPNVSYEDDGGPVEGVPDQSNPDADESISQDAPSLVSELEEIPVRNCRTPEHYNQTSRESYETILSCHHLQTQRHPKEKILEYNSSKAQVVSNIICHLREKYHGQLFNL